MALLAPLNSTFLKFEHVDISNLDAGSIFLTFYPNFNVPLKDKKLPTLLKVQIQITEAEQIALA